MLRLSEANGAHRQAARHERRLNKCFFAYKRHTKEVTVAFVEKAKEYLDAGVRASKDMLTKAGAAAQEMGDKGVLKVEITQLKAKRKKQYESLGSAVYGALCIGGDKSITAKTKKISIMLEEIARLQALIDEKTEAFNKLQTASEK
jgi:uncharacterized small protein (DUF1192 family)